ncbi:uncharacterized protein BDCG_16098 [Blastomyces dermatitidis ER-3]|uniref:Uncharacterized protein n=1 Tax=Ajellomyces dermatitidis (strain ER-3 / ATCC MYA-2586) TaxID=559297 RepID=A0ABX2VR15_AJEDR|nr:uncharacterized protein BDCG_16098 [Blastomyces dermatitidis ER-3]OAS99381.1 hypothetical protein BDCG_16098 [Blastomyces dermatitidis ER-3]
MAMLQSSKHPLLGRPPPLPLAACIARQTSGDILSSCYRYISRAQAECRQE